MQEKSFLQIKCLIFTIYVECILIGPTVEMIFIHQGFATDQYHCVPGQIPWSKCSVLRDIIALPPQLQSFTAGWYLRALALSSHTLNWSVNHVRQSDVHRSIATGNHRRLSVLLFVQCTLHSSGKQEKWLVWVHGEVWLQILLWHLWSSYVLRYIPEHEVQWNMLPEWQITATPANAWKLMQMHACFKLVNHL